MAEGGENLDFSALKQLLNSWRVGILYELFKDEDITINEMKMMQLSHVNVLLKDEKLGVKIRFEHHFNSWRNKIGLPLEKVNSTDRHCINCCCCNCKVLPASNIPYAVEDSSGQDVTRNLNSIKVRNRRKSKRLNVKRTSRDLTELNCSQEPLSPQSVNSNSSLVKMWTSNEIVNFTPVPVLESTASEQAVHNTDDDAEMENLPLNALCDILNDIETKPPKFPSKSIAEKYPVSLQQILDMSGSRGTTIINFYREKNRLTNIHRTQLIQTIVDYFDVNDHHLSLNMSHVLEWEILQMFPTEKLEYYRTEKRGKIYVKFSNMKRYKRERNNKLKQEIQTAPMRSRRYQATHENMKKSGNFNQQYGECVAPQECTEPEICVKEEGDSSDKK